MFERLVAEGVAWQLGSRRLKGTWRGLSGGGGTCKSLLSSAEPTSRGAATGVFEMHRCSGVGDSF